VHLKKNPEAEKLDGNRWGINFPIDYRRVFFLIAVFSGCTVTVKLQVSTSTLQFLWWGLPIQAFLAPGWGEVLILSQFIWKYPHVHLQKNHTSEHPLPDLKPDLGFLSNFGLEQTFKIFKNLQNIFLLAEAIKATVQY
jgi:hypothetical protein